MRVSGRERRNYEFNWSGLKVTIIMDYSETNRKIMNKFENLLHVYYEEPVDGKFSDDTTSILSSIHGYDKSESDLWSDTDSEY